MKWISCLAFALTFSAASRATDIVQYTSPAQVATTPHVLEAADLEAFFDGVIPLQLERADIAGASVLVMQGDKTLLQKGYGFSDVKARKPVDPESTMFRLASISKLFTWIAVMQLVEQGKLDLDVSIDRYLDFPIKTKTGISAPISLRDLMTHRGGFEETVRNIIVTEPRYYQDLRTFLTANQPRRLFEPGTIPAYSNYGVGLGSYIVQRVSGQPFEAYVAEHIFSPLGMTHSTFYQPPRAPLDILPSQGYSSSTIKPIIGFEQFSPVGAGGLSSSASDMGRFGQALLNGGEFDGHRILKAESLQEMWKPQFSANEQLPPIGLGFYQAWRNQLKWIGHQGDVVAFHSLFFVEPQQKLVLFISYNSAGSAGKTRTELLNDFSDRYFPADLKPKFMPAARDTLKDVEGAYQPTRRSDSTVLKLLAMLSQIHASVDKDGVLKVDKFKDLRGHPFEWRPIGKDLWQQLDDQNRLFAIRGTDGHIERLAVSFAGAQFQRVPWYEMDNLVLASLGTSLFVLICVLFNALLRLARRFVLRSSEPVPPGGRVRLDVLAVVSAIYWMVLMAALVAVFAKIGGDDAMPPTSAWDDYLLWSDVLIAIAIVLSGLSAWSAIRIWRRPSTSVISQLKYTLVGLACLNLSWFVMHWHVITPVHRL
jgi:CubicO group peptidase (beta-lactamase class C family)